MVVETMGNLLKVRGHRADRADSVGARLLLSSLKSAFPRLAHWWVDRGYQTSGGQWVEQAVQWTITGVSPPYRPRGDTAKASRELLGDPAVEQRFANGFRLLPRRWVVESTFAWFGQQRRRSQDYECLCSTEEAWLYLTLSRLLLRRLAHPNA